MGTWWKYLSTVGPLDAWQRNQSAWWVCGQLPLSACQDWHGGYHHSREGIGRPESSTLRKDKPRLILFSFPFYGSIFDIQHRVSFWCTAKWFSYLCRYIYINILFHIDYYNILNIIPSCTVNPCFLPVLYIVVLARILSCVQLFVTPWTVAHQ